MTDPQETAAPQESAAPGDALASASPNSAHLSAAEQAIGFAESDRDWAFEPQRHVTSLPPAAGALKRVLSRPEIRRLMDEYRQFDAEATRAQRRFRSGRFALRVMALAAAAAGAAALGLNLLLRYVSDLQLIALALHFLLILAIVVLAAVMDRRDSRARWRRARGEAEWRRISYFARIAEAEEPHDAAAGEIPAAPLQLAYFRRYQLMTQLRFFEGRPKQLERAIGLASSLTGAALAVAFLAFIAALVLGVELLQEQGVAMPSAATRLASPEILALAPWALGAVALSSAYAVLMTRSEPTEAMRLSARYRKLGRNLRYLYENGYEQVRRATEAGDRSAMARFVGLVHTRLLGEVEEWLSSDVAGARGGEPPSASAVEDLNVLLAMEPVKAAR